MKYLFCMTPLVTTISFTPMAFSQTPVLEEVIITAQKRVQSLQDVPISVSAISGEKMSQSGLQRFEDFTAYIPNFSVAKDPVGDKINIRGIQSGTQAGFEQSVGIFVDGIYRGRSVQSRYAFLDVEMVEVLRGPQGTLFGKNTIAGALNIRSARPTTEFEAQLSASYNLDFEETEYQGVVSGPVSETLRARLALLDRRKEKGWVDNVAYSTQSIGQSDESAARFYLEWDASEQTTVGMRYEYADFENVGMPWDLLDGGPLNSFSAVLGDSRQDNYKTAMGNRPTDFGVLDLSATDPNGVLDFGTNNLLEGLSEELMVRLESQLDNGSTVTAIGGYSAYQYERFLDADFGPLNAVRFDDTEDFQQSSVELRLVSDTGQTIEYIAGLFLQQQDMLVDGLSYFHTDTLRPVLGAGCSDNINAVLNVVGSGTGTPALDAQSGAIAAITNGERNAAAVNNCALFAATLNGVGNGISGVNRYAVLEQETQTRAMFGQATWNINEILRLTMGLRYTEEEKSAAQRVYATDFIERGTLETTNPITLGLAQLAGEFTRHDFSENDPGMKRDEKSLTWSANIQWDVNADTLLYLSSSTGFKAGGFNSFYMGGANGSGANSNDIDFEEEEVFSIELGSKMSLFEGSAEINVAAFRTAFDNLQAAIFSGNTTFSVQNAAEAVSQGIEIDARWQATDKLTLSGAVGWIDFEFEKFPNQACTNDQFVSARQSRFDAAAAEGDIASMVGTALVYTNANCSADAVNNLAGKTSENTPEYQISAAAKYIQAIGEYELLLNVDVNWMDEAYRQADLDKRSLSDSLLKINTSAVLSPQNGSWDVSLIIKNLTDEASFSWMNDTPLFSGSYDYVMDAPRSVTISGRYRF